jgi:hypothetical protein
MPDRHLPLVGRSSTSQGTPGGDRTYWSGLRLAALPLALSAASLALAACGSASASRSDARPVNPNDVYGPLPSWLPTSSTAVDKVAIATPKNPQLGIPGNPIEVVLPHGRALVTLSGPTVPPFVTPPPPAVTSTFTVTLSKTSGTVPISASDFQLIDGNGDRFQPTAFTGAQPPTVAPDGRSVTFRVSEYMAVGSGSIRWAPGGTPIATWEYTVEDD